MPTASERECAQLCWRMEDCNAWTFELGTQNCFPKTSLDCNGDAKDWSFGTAGCGAAGGKRRKLSGSNAQKLAFF